MDPNRRDFLRSSAAAAGAMSLGLTSVTPEAAAGAVSAARTPARALNILFLGGTNFTGPHTVHHALKRGHSVTVFNRGQTEPGLYAEEFRQVEKLVGDRADNLEALKGRRWDAVIDGSGMNEAWAKSSTELLRDAAEHYLFISSTGVFYPYLTTEISEDTQPLLEDPSGGEDGAAGYGVMKAKSENEVRAKFGDRAIISRPGYIVGPLDKTHRFTYWPARFQRGGEILAMGRKSDQVQMIDVRDVAEWHIKMLEEGITGTFNTTGPASPLTMEEFLYGMKATTSVPSSFTWIEDYDFLEEHDVSWAIPWIIAAGQNLGSQRMDCARARAAGLTFRSLAETATDTLAYWNSDVVGVEGRAAARMAVSPEKEAEVLAAWKARGM